MPLKPLALVSGTLKAGVQANAIEARKLTMEIVDRRPQIGVQIAHYGTNQAGRKVYGYSTDDDGRPTQDFSTLSVDVQRLVNDGWTSLTAWQQMTDAMLLSLYVRDVLIAAVSQAERAFTQAKAQADRKATLEAELATILASPELTNAAAVQTYATPLNMAVKAVTKGRNDVKAARDAVIAQVDRLKTLTTVEDVQAIMDGVYQAAIDQSALAVSLAPGVQTAADAAVAVFRSAQAACVWAAEGGQ